MGTKPLPRRLLDRLLAPAGWAFHAAGRLRADYYADPSRRVRLPAPCVSVGNLTFGGTGKTPFTVFLARECLALGFKPAVLLRGYGRRSSGARAVRPESGWREVGDEALVLCANLPGVPVLVGERRHEAAALAPPGTDLFLLDDAFQHLRVHRDLDIVLLDASRPEDLVPPPTGRLREPLDALSRAHLLVLARGTASDLPYEVALRWAGRPRTGARFLWEERSLPDGLPWTELADEPAAAFSGVGNPETFFAQAEEAGLRLVSHTAFPDHAEPAPARRAELLRALEEGGARWLLCTEKDFVKWRELWTPADPPLRFPRLRVRLDDPSECLRRSLLALRDSGSRPGPRP